MSLVSLGFTFLSKEKRKKAGSVSSEIIQAEDKFVNKTQIYTGKNRRKCFRVEVDNIYCIIKFIDFANSKLNKLKNRTINGYIENISLSGLKIVSDYELPVRSDIRITISFKLEDYVFTMKGKIVRREDHIENKYVGYGVEFLELLPNQRKQLNMLLNKIYNLKHAHAL